MTEATFAVLMVLVLGWAVTSHLLDRLNITGALVFAVAGYLLGNPTWGPLAVDVETPAIHLLAELTLALLLFSDAARVNVSQLRRDLSFPGRLLGIGLPLSVILGESTPALPVLLVPVLLVPVLLVPVLLAQVPAWRSRRGRRRAAPPPG